MKFQIVMLSLLLGTIGIAMQAQTGPGPGKCMSNYDPKTEATMSGTVDRVTQQNGHGGWQGTHLFLKTDTGTMEVHVGPADYITSQQFSFATGDVVEVTGSKVKIQHQDVLIAREIKKEGKTLVLRNAQGVPSWSRGRRS
jgi:DNA/RNA endonuclease YhcR with UshA esterase domain